MLNSSATFANSTSGPSSHTLLRRCACYVFYGLVLFFGILGNVIVFYVIGYCRKKRNSGDIYMLSLACADFLASLVNPMVMLSDLITDFSGWFYGEILCYIMPSVIPLTMCAPSWSLVLISVDRLRVISSPMVSNLRKRYLYGSIALIWFSSMGISFPYTLRFRFTEDACLSSYSKVLGNETFVVLNGILLLCIWCIPSIIMMLVYYFTARALKTNTCQHENSRAMEQGKRQNAKAVKTFAIVIVVFLLLTVPYAVFFFFINYDLVYGASADFRLYANLIYILFAVSSANGCVNPLIYAKMHREINRYIRRIVQMINNFTACIFHRRNHNFYAQSSAWSVPASRACRTSLMQENYPEEVV